MCGRYPIKTSLQRIIEATPLRSCLLLSFHLILLLAASGCATVTVATAGTIAGIAATSISTGAEVYKWGKLDAVEMDTFEDSVAAVRLAARDLQLKIVKDLKPDAKQDRWSFLLSDDLKDTISIDLDRRTQRLTAMRINVGLFGSEPTARLVLARIRTHLPSLAAPGRSAAPTTRSTCRSRDCTTRPWLPTENR